jgi:hypothetical protein
MTKHAQYCFALIILALGSAYCTAQIPLVDQDPPETGFAQTEIGSVGPQQLTDGPSDSAGSDSAGRYSESPAAGPANSNSPYSLPGSAQPEAQAASIPTGTQPFPGNRTDPRETTSSTTELPSALTQQFIKVQFTTNRPVTTKVQMANGRIVEVVRYVLETQSTNIAIDEDLNELDLPAEGKRVAVRAVTAARHHGLLDELKSAKTPEEKEAAGLALKDNYTEHYAIETWWREQKLAELESRLKEIRAQVTQRQESEEKYVAAAMTIAGLWADGIGITPPTPNRQPLGAVTQPVGRQPQPVWLTPRSESPSINSTPIASPSVFAPAFGQPQYDPYSDSTK